MVRWLRWRRNADESREDNMKTHYLFILSITTLLKGSIESMFMWSLFWKLEATYTINKYMFNIGIYGSQLIMNIYIIFTSASKSSPFKWIQNSQLLIYTKYIGSTNHLYLMSIIIYITMNYHKITTWVRVTMGILLWPKIKHSWTNLK